MSFASWLSSFARLYSLSERTLRHHPRRRRNSMAMDRSVEICEARLVLSAAPIFSPNSYTFSVDETAASDTTVGTLAATDADNDIMGYNITAGDSNSVFTIDSSGNLKVNGTLDYEMTNSYTLTVQVQDMDGNSDTATVTVNINDVAEAPVFSPATYTFSVAENSASETTVGTLSATDPQNDIMGYSITAGDPNSAFTIDSSGNLKVNGTLDYETTNSYTLTVQVQDMGGHSATATVTVNITNVDEAPVFSSATYTFSVAENTASETLVGTVSATDPQNDIMGYSITAGDPNSAFTIDSSGNVKVNGTLDYETTNSYTLTVEVQDMGGHTGTATVTVNITDVDGNQMTGWAISSPAQNGTVDLDQTGGFVTISGARGTNPDGKTVTLVIWDLNSGGTSPWATYTINDDLLPTWSVTFTGSAGSFYAELSWTGISLAAFNDPRTVDFTVTGIGGDPTP